MKKQIINIGKALNKAEQKEILGGKRLAPECNSDSDCWPGGQNPGCSVFNTIPFCDSNDQCSIKEC